MSYIKKSDIEMIGEDGTYQLVIDDHCVTGYNFKTADACYKSYIVDLLKAIDKARSALN